MRVEQVPDPKIEEPTDIVIRVTSTGLCGSDLHLYETLAPFMEPGDIVGHEPMGVVEEVGSRRHPPRRRRPGRHPVQRQLRPLLDVRAQAARASARPPRTASTAPAPACSATASSTARCRAGRRSTSASRTPTSAPSRCRNGPPDDRFLFLSDVLPTAWQARRVRRRPRRRHAAGARRRARSATWPRGSRMHRGLRVIVGRPGAGAAPAGRRARRRGHRHHRPRRRRAWPTWSATRPAAAAPTRSSTRSAWRRTAPAASRRCRSWSGCCRTCVAEPLMLKAGHGPADGAHHRLRRRTSRRHGLDRRGVRRRGRPAADVPDVRQAGAGPDGPGQRARLDRRHPRPAQTRTRTCSAWRRSRPTTCRSTRRREAYENFQKKEDGAVKIVFPAVTARVCSVGTSGTCVVTAGEEEP